MNGLRWNLFLVLSTLACYNCYDIRFVTPVSDVDMLTVMINGMELNQSYGTNLRVHTLENMPGDNQLLLYHLSGTNYGYQLSKVYYTSEYKITKLVTPYKATYQERQSGLAKLRTPVCPDVSIQYVAATAFDIYPSALNYTVLNYWLASGAGLSSQLLVGLAATRQNYLDYLSCPGLEGFNNIGHGTPNEIFVYDGSISSDDLLNYDFQGLTVIVFNSCNVMDPPMSNTMVSANTRFYAGGISELQIGTSEPVTYCFWQAALSESNMTSSAKLCSALDPLDVWGSEDPSGNNYFGTKMRS
jgi:hypothetical protein